MTDVRCQIEMIRVTLQKPHVFVPYLPTTLHGLQAPSERAQRLKHGLK